MRNCVIVQLVVLFSLFGRWYRRPEAKALVGRIRAGLKSGLFCNAQAEGFLDDQRPCSYFASFL